MTATSGLAPRRAARHAARRRAGGGAVRRRADRGAARRRRPALLATLARSYLITVSIAGALSLLIALLAGAGILRPLRVVSDSMAPAFAARDLVVATSWPTAWIGVGDVVVARSPRSDRLDVAHRIIAIAPTPDGAELHLRGDANPAPDPEDYPVGRTVSRVWFSVPGGAAGYSLLTRPQVGVPLLGGLALLAILAATTAGADAPRAAAADASRPPRDPARSRIRRGRRG